MNISELENYVKQILPQAGPNKLREIVRLMYEIAKRENVSPQSVLSPAEKLTFEAAKKKLLARRYPVNFNTAPKDKFYLPKLELDAQLQADLTPRPF